MFEGLFTHHQSVFGLDIGHDSLKVVLLKQYRQKYILQSYNTVSIPSGSLVKNAIREPEKILAALKEALTTAKPHPIDATEVISALPESHVFTKIISLPSNNPEKIKQMINFQAGEIFPIPLEEIYFDWQMLGKSPSSVPIISTPTIKKPLDATSSVEKTPPAPPAPGQEEILAVATPRQLVNSFQSFLQKGGFNILALETKPIAIARSLVGPKDKKGILLLDIGAESSSITIVDKGVMRFTGTAASGGNAITRIISQITKTSLAEAEKMKVSGKINLNDDTTKHSVSSALTPIVEEINQAIRYYQTRIQPSSRISTIRLTGGSALLPGLDSLLKDQIGYPVEIGNPLINLSNIPKDTNPINFNQYATAIGCALRNFME